MSPPLDASAFLDLRRTKCPLNFVKARLAMEKLPQEGMLTLWLAHESQSALNVPQSLTQEGYVLREAPYAHPEDPSILIAHIQHASKHE
ncbi:MAG: sulfurtransferase TusA family protein [Vampirovibrionales bacterium]